MRIKISYVYFLVALQNLDHQGGGAKSSLFAYFPEQEATYVYFEALSDPLSSTFFRVYFSITIR